MISKDNINMTVKVRSDVYEWIKKFATLYHCSISSVGAYMITNAIIQVSDLSDNRLEEIADVCKSPAYDLRRK